LPMTDGARLRERWCGPRYCKLKFKPEDGDGFTVVAKPQFLEQSAPPCASRSSTSAPSPQRRAAFVLQRVAGSCWSQRDCSMPRRKTPLTTGPTTRSSCSPGVSKLALADMPWRTADERWPAATDLPAADTRSKAPVEAEICRAVLAVASEPKHFGH